METGRPAPEGAGINPTVEKTVNALLNDAEKDALERISSQTPEATARIKNTLERRLKPYVTENEVIAQQLDTPEYKAFIKEADEFLGAKTGVAICPDGRISSFSLGDPRVTSFNRRLQGLPEIRKSTRTGKAVLNDPDLAASITTSIQEKKNGGDKTPEIVEFIGPHIHSQHPEHGCGACITKLKSKGRTPELGMKLGGIAEYFEELGDGFFAFDNVAEAAGGRGTTFDLAHDAFSQGFIVGLRQEYKNLNESLSLRENLSKLSQAKKILMTESLDSGFRQTILDEAAKLGKSRIDVNDFYKFAENAMLIGRIAQKLTMQEQEKGFQWLPDNIKQGKSDTAIKVFAYYALRNVVYRTLGNISSGQHHLLEHPERLIRVGPIGAEFNMQNIPFIQNAPRGRFEPIDIQGAKNLYHLSYEILQHQGVDFRQEGRIILVTGEYDQTLYANKKAARKGFNEIASVVRNNAAWIREELNDGVQAGEAIVIGCIYDPATRKLTNILSS